MRRDVSLALLLLAALAVAYLFGRCAHDRGVALEAWKDSTAIARKSSEEAVEAFRREQLATSAAAASLDSARAAWERAVGMDTLEIQATTLAALPATLPRNPLLTPGLRLAQACTVFQSACERATAAASAAIDSLERENALLRRRPADDQEPRLAPFAAGGYDLGARVPVAKLGAELRLARDWRLSLDASRRLAPGDTTRLTAWVTWRF